VFLDNEPDGIAERGLYKAAFKAAGLDVVGDYSFPMGTTDFSSFINDATVKNAQLWAGKIVPRAGSPCGSRCDHLVSNRGGRSWRKPRPGRV